MRRVELMEHIRGVLSRDARVVAVYLFGSRARGDDREASDVDVAVLLDEIPKATLDAPTFELESRLEQVIGLPVQLIRLNEAPPDLVHRVLRDGELVCESDRGRRIQFEIQARNAFFDLQPILERYRKAPTAHQ